MDILGIESSSANMETFLKSVVISLLTQFSVYSKMIMILLLLFKKY